MFSEKLGVLFMNLTTTERSKLGKFIQSTYFNEQAHLTRLYETLMAELLRDDQKFKALSKPALWQKAYPQLPYNDNQLRKWMHELTQLIYKFLRIEALEKDTVVQCKLLRTAFDKPALTKYQANVEVQLQEHLKQTDVWGADYYLLGHELSFDQLVQGKATQLFERIQESQKHLDIFYYARSFRLSIAQATYALTHAIKNEKTDRAIAPLPAESTLLLTPLIKAYQLAYLCFISPEDTALYQDFTEYLSAHEAQLPMDDLSSLYQIGINYCVIKINGGSNEYYPEIFALYKKMTENRLILTNHVLAEGMYKNIVTTALAVKEYDWIETFIRTQSQYLPPEVRENTMSFNLANVLYSQKRYDEVIQLVQRVEYSDVVYNLGARWLLLRTYYELDAIKPLESLLESFRIYLLRNQVISVHTKKEYLSLISFVGKLLKIRHDRDKLAQLKQKVLATQMKLPKRWIIEKIEELEKKSRI